MNQETEASISLDAIIRRTIELTLERVAPHIASKGDEWIDRKRFEAEFNQKFDRVLAAAKRGLIAVQHNGKTPVVQRKELERWFQSRKVVAARRAAVPGDLSFEEQWKMIAQGKK